MLLLVYGAEVDELLYHDGMTYVAEDVSDDVIQC